MEPAKGSTLDIPQSPAGGQYLLGALRAPGTGHAGHNEY